MFSADFSQPNNYYFIIAAIENTLRRAMILD